MTLFELIMGGPAFTKKDWSMMGSGQITDEDTIKRMLMEGYEAVANDD